MHLACRVLSVSESGYYDWRDRAPSPRAVRHVWLTDLIRQIHTESFGVYGAPRVHAELTLGRGIVVGTNTARDAHAPCRDQGLAQQAPAPATP